LYDSFTLVILPDGTRDEWTMSELNQMTNRNFGSAVLAIAPVKLVSSEFGERKKYLTALLEVSTSEEDAAEWLILLGTYTNHVFKL
jgi:uncharacterized protein